MKAFDRRQKTIFNTFLDRRPQSADLDFNELCNYLRDCTEVVPPYYLRRAKLPSELTYAQVIELIDYGFEQFCIETLDELTKAGLVEKVGCLYRLADLPPERRTAILKELGIDDAD